MKQKSDANLVCLPRFFFFSKTDTLLDKIDKACCNEITSSADDFEIIFKGDLKM